jgi:hypothetical protein
MGSADNLWLTSRVLFLLSMPFFDVTDSIEVMDGEMKRKGNYFETRRVKENNHLIDHSENKTANPKTKNSKLQSQELETQNWNCNSWE